MRTGSTQKVENIYIYIYIYFISRRLSNSAKKSSSTNRLLAVHLLSNSIRPRPFHRDYVIIFFVCLQVSKTTLLKAAQSAASASQPKVEIDYKAYSRMPDGQRRRTLSTPTHDTTTTSTSIDASTSAEFVAVPAALVRLERRCPTPILYTSVDSHIVRDVASQVDTQEFEMQYDYRGAASEGRPPVQRKGDT